MTKLKKRKPRKTRCVVCHKRMYVAPGGEGTKERRKTCDDCLGIDGYTCAGPTPAPIPEAQVFKRDEVIRVTFDLDTHEVVGVSSGPAQDVDPLAGWLGWE